MAPERDAVARVRAAARAARRVLRLAPSGLFADVDGTLSRITDRPEEATVAPATRDALERLAERLALVAAVTGRAVDDARRIVGTDRIGYVGNHGLERRRGGATTYHPLALPFVERVAGVLRALAARPPVAGMVLEDKGATASVHYRLSPDPPAARAALLRALEPLIAEAGLRLTEGRLVLNVLPPVGVDKGTAIEELIAEHGLRAAVFLGDDVTDVDALRALRRVREARGIATLGIGVWSPEGPPEIVEAADVVVHGVGDVERLLHALARSA